MKKALSFLMVAAVTVSVTSSMANDTQSCSSAPCDRAQKSWKTVRTGTENAAHSTGKWGHKTGQTIARWGEHTGQKIGKWGETTGHKIGAWGSGAAKDTKTFLTGH